MAGHSSVLLLLLLLGAVLDPGLGQHWSYGLNPGGKRDLDDFSDALRNVIISYFTVHSNVLYSFLQRGAFNDLNFLCSLQQMVEDFPQVPASCSALDCAEQMFRMKGFLDRVNKRETGHRTYKK
ncbi:uncharacterized protein V6R79_001533 [Siganus canaliculatus]